MAKPPDAVLDHDHAIDDQAEVDRAQAHQAGGDAGRQHDVGGEEHRQRNRQRHDQAGAQLPSNTKSTTITKTPPSTKLWTTVCNVH